MSKKFLFTVTLVIAITSSYAFATAQPYCELDANHTRLDMGNANLATRVSNGNWLVINIPAGSGEYTAQISSGGECWSPLSNAIVGIKEADMQVLSISPNPTKGNIGLTVSSDNAGYYNIVIVDIAGKEVSSIPNASLGGMTYNIDISRFDAGTYFIKLFPLQKGAIITEKIIKE